MQRRTLAPSSLRRLARSIAPSALRHPPLSLASALLAVFALASLVATTRAAVPGFTPAPAYAAEPLGLSADTFAVAPDGRFATGASSAAGATITVYNHAAPAGRRILAVVTDPALRFLGGLAFDGRAFEGRDTLLVSENGAQHTVFALSLSTGALQPLAPAGSIPKVAQVRVRPTDGKVFAVAANAPGKGALYTFTGGQAVPFATGLGAGYLGGLAFDPAGNVYVADTNDPDFTGAPGRILALSATGAPLGALSLAGGGGSGAYDVARDASGSFYATTGATVTRILGGAAWPLGHFTGDFPFPTDIAVDPFGGVLVNGAFTGAGGLFRIYPQPYAIRQRMPRPAPAPATRPMVRPGGR